MLVKQFKWDVLSHMYMCIQQHAAAQRFMQFYLQTLMLSAALHPILLFVHHPAGIYWFFIGSLMEFLLYGWII